MTATKSMTEKRDLCEEEAIKHVDQCALELRFISKFEGMCSYKDGLVYSQSDVDRRFKETFKSGWQKCAEVKDARIKQLEDKVFQERRILNEQHDALMKIKDARIVELEEALKKIKRVNGMMGLGEAVSIAEEALK